VYTLDPDDPQVRLGTEMLPADGGEHIHGLLRVVVNGRDLPYLGYFGPDDVCIGQWAHEFSQMTLKLSETQQGRYVFDEGEQGQPAFEFRRDGSRAFVSIIASQFDSDAKGDPEWQDVCCDFDELLSSMRNFLAGLRSRLNLSAPDAASAWWRRNVDRQSP
jgi:hypothetical protein